MRRTILIFSVLVLTAGIVWAFFTPQASFDINKARNSFRKGLLLYNIHQYDASINYFLQSLDHNSKFHPARKALGQALYFSGQVDEALTEWKILLESGNYDPVLKNHLQNLTSIHVERELIWKFESKLANKKRYKYSFPSFLLNLPNHNFLLLNKGQLNTGSIIEIDANTQFRNNLRRGNQKFGYPMGAATNNNLIWISDFKNDIIHRIPLNFSWKMPFFQDLKELNGKFDDIPLRGPAGICYAKDSWYVVDSGNSRILKFDTGGEFKFSFSKGKNGFSLKDPFGIACTSDEELIVSEPDEGRLSFFDKYGNFLRFVENSFLIKPRHLSIYPDRNLVVIADEKSGVHIWNRKTDQWKTIDSYQKNGVNQKFLRPYSALIDHFGNLFVADYAAHSIYHFVPEQFLYSNLEIWAERTDSTQFPTVALSVSVKDQFGNYLTDLTEENFQIIENDALIKNIRTDYYQQFKNQISWIIIAPQTNEFSEYNNTVPWILDFLFPKIKGTDKIKVIRYDEKFYEASDWTNSKLKIKSALTNKKPFNSKIDSLDKALYFSISELLPKIGKRAIIWMTDGSYDEKLMKTYSFSRIENYARFNHIPIHIISFEHPNYRKQNQIDHLKEFTKNVAGSYHQAFGQLKNLHQLILDSPEERYLINFHSAGNPKWKDQYMEIKILVDFQKRKGVENFGYFIP